MSIFFRALKQIRWYSDIQATKKPSGWAAPSGLLVPKPYRVNRTPSNNLPVYTDIRNGRTRILTLVRKVEGNATALSTDLAKLLGVSVYEKVGRIEIPGNHIGKVRQYLQQLGF